MDLRAGSPDGRDFVKDVESFRFADGEDPVQSFGQGTLWRSFAADGFVGEVGGRGAFFGTALYQDIRVLDLPGTVTFDGSFNKGGDIVRLAGNASKWSVSSSGSNAIFDDGDTTVVLPYGAIATSVAFADGTRSLRYDAAADSLKIGSQVIGETAGTITAPASGSPPAGNVVPGASNRVFTATSGEVFASGKLAIFGTNGQEDVHLTSGNVLLDGSFNKGGDTISLAQAASAFTVRESGSNVILHSATLDLTIPYGPAGTTIAFGNDERTLRYDQALDVLLLGSQTIGTEPIPVTAGTI